jgi:hypothetical protein
MTVLDRWRHPTAVSTEDDIPVLRHGGGGYTTQVKPPRNHGADAVLPVVRAMMELSTRWLGLRNDSPVMAFEIRRPMPDTLTLQYSVPTKRLDRKIRNELRQTVPGVAFDEGATGLPVTSTESVGGGILTLGRKDWYPLETDHDSPANNAVTSLLHRHAMPNAKIVIQLLVQPVAGQPVRQWWWKHRACKTVGYLRKEKENLWGSRPPTPRERQQADAVERKAATPRFKTSLRVVVIGADEQTPSYVHEVASGYNVFESLETGQFFTTETVAPFRERRVVNFAQAVAGRQFGRWSRAFSLNPEELACLLSLPSQDQQNIVRADP